MTQNQSLFLQEIGEYTDAMFFVYGEKYKSAVIEHLSRKIPAIAASFGFDHNDFAVIIHRYLDDYVAVLQRHGLDHMLNNLPQERKFRVVIHAIQHRFEKMEIPSSFTWEIFRQIFDANSLVLKLRQFDDLVRDFLNQYREFLKFEVAVGDDDKIPFLRFVNDKRLQIHSGKLEHVYKVWKAMATLRIGNQETYFSVVNQIMDALDDARLEGHMQSEC